MASGGYVFTRQWLGRIGQEVFAISLLHLIILSGINKKVYSPWIISNILIFIGFILIEWSYNFKLYLDVD